MKLCINKLQVHWIIYLYLLLINSYLLPVHGKDKVNDKVKVSFINFSNRIIVLYSKEGGKNGKLKHVGKLDPFRGVFLETEDGDTFESIEEQQIPQLQQEINLSPKPQTFTIKKDTSTIIVGLNYGDEHDKDGTKTEKEQTRSSQVRIPRKKESVVTLDEPVVSTLDKFAVKCSTSNGDIHITIIPKWSPFGAARFLELVDVGFYNGCGKDFNCSNIISLW